MDIQSQNSKRAEIEAIAAKLGASDWAIRKWWDRGAVPSKWQLAIMDHSKGKIGRADFAKAIPLKVAS